MRNEKILIWKNKIMCSVLPIIGYPTINKIVFKGGIHLKNKRAVIKNSTFLIPS